MKNKKVFELSAIKKYKKYEKMLMLIPLAVMLIIAVSPGGRTVLKGFAEKPDIKYAAGSVLFFITASITISVIPFFIGKIIIKTEIKTTIKNCTIANMHDFDYYRDKLTGLSPAVISLLTNLEIEQKKDVAASILQYENFGILTESPDHTYRTTEKYNSFNGLRESDRYLIEHLEKGDFKWENDCVWKQSVINEAVSDGYIISDELSEVKPAQQTSNQKRPVPKFWRLIQVALGVIWVLCFIKLYPELKNINAPVQPGQTIEEILTPQLMSSALIGTALFIFAIFIIVYKPDPEKSKRKGSNKGCLVLLFPVIWFIWGINALPRLYKFMDLCSSVPDGSGIGTQFEIIFSETGTIFEFTEVMALFLTLMFMIAFIFSAFHVSSIINKNAKKFRRTDYGNYMAECIYGMKNFIHDYSNLSMADKRQVILWEDYLVYAVVLEENEEIVNEISKMRSDFVC